MGGDRRLGARARRPGKSGPQAGPDAAPLGVTLEPGGARLRVRADAAERLWLCLFAGPEADESERLPLERGADGIWEGVFERLGPGSVYGLRADGPYEPRRGLWFDPAKLLLDPYAREVIGNDRWHPLLAADPPGRDSAAVAPRAVVAESAFDWRGDRPLRIPWRKTVIYEAHVKGLTRRHPEVPPAERGTYRGLGHPAVIDHLVDLGVTAVQLLPVQQFLSERHLVEAGLTNYWGYNPCAFFAPHAGWAAGQDPVAEFKEMVRRLHAAGLEVLLDVVFNHTAEGGATGSTLSLRGLDNRAYYRLAPDDRGRYLDYSGCGNTLDFGSPAVLDLALDCLRYWVREMHVDGFRFDLAPILGRGPGGDFDPAAPFFARVARDPELAGVKLIAEPWDLGPEGYRLGGFPEGWREWNDRFRDCVRAYWRDDPEREQELRLRLDGSSDLFGERGPDASINYVTCHDGFTLEDLVSYERRHNRANGEGNRDGPRRNLSSNWGVEGPTRDPEIRALRRRAKRGMMASLLLARGVPMLSHGDELCRTQRGNNNAYCHDGELTWVDWSADAAACDLHGFLRGLLRLRRRRLGLD